MPSLEEILLKTLEGLTTGAVKGRDAAIKLKEIEDELKMKQEAISATPEMRKYVESQTSQPRPEGMSGPETETGAFVPGTSSPLQSENRTILDTHIKQQKLDKPMTELYVNPSTRESSQTPKEGFIKMTVPSETVFKNILGKPLGSLKFDGFDDNGQPIFSAKEGNISSGDANVLLRENDQKNKTSSVTIREELLKLKSPEAQALAKKIEKLSKIDDPTFQASLEFQQAMRKDPNFESKQRGELARAIQDAQSLFKGKKSSTGKSELDTSDFDEFK